MRWPYVYRYPVLLFVSFISLGILVAGFLYLRFKANTLVDRFTISEAGSSIIKSSRAFLITAIIIGLILLLALRLSTSQKRIFLNLLAFIYILFAIIDIAISLVLFDHKFYIDSIKFVYNRFDKTSKDQFEVYYSCSGFENSSDSYPGCKQVFEEFRGNYYHYFIAIPLAAALLILFSGLILALTCKKQSDFVNQLYQGLIPDDFPAQENRRSHVNSSQRYTEPNEHLFSAATIQENNKNKASPYDQAPGYDIY